ncbi:type II toxin-antitoxin system HicB family antitoxin [Candidatus Micrarchaeota archaeon]|nr:type II toxin-antitoxin system HicB family antitoxin [Candidatus Micrarchaeota archaeon]
MNVLGFSAVIVPEGKSFSAWCPDLDVASQGDDIKQALANLKEAVELHLECLTSSELKQLRKQQGKRLVTTLEIPFPA